MRASVFAVFAQDDFRLRPNLTLNLGLRWDAPLNWYGANGTIGAIYQSQRNYRPTPDARPKWLPQHPVEQ